MRLRLRLELSVVKHRHAQSDPLFSLRSVNSCPPFDPPSSSSIHIYRPSLCVALTFIIHQVSLHQLSSRPAPFPLPLFLARHNSTTASTAPTTHSFPTNMKSFLSSLPYWPRSPSSLPNPACTSRQGSPTYQLITKFEHANPADPTFLTKYSAEIPELAKLHHEVVAQSSELQRSQALR